MENTQAVLSLVPDDYFKFKRHYMTHKKISNKEFLEHCDLSSSAETRIRYGVKRIQYFPSQKLMPQKVINAAALWICECYNLGIPDLLDPMIFATYMEDWIKDKSLKKILQITGYGSKNAFQQTVNRHATVLIGRILKYEIQKKNLNLNDMKVWEAK